MIRITLGSRGALRAQNGHGVLEAFGKYVLVAMAGLQVAQLCIDICSISDVYASHTGSHSEGVAIKSAAGQISVCNMLNINTS